MSLARRSAAVTALLALAACDAAKSPPPVAVPLATPPGVTLRETRGYRDAANIYVPGPVAYAVPANGVTDVYVYITAI